MSAHTHTRSAPPLPYADVGSAFAASASAHPRRTAVIEGGHRLDYATLDERSRRIAAGLRGRGVGAGDRVVVALPRGVDSIAVTLGAVRAGGVYVPVDLGWPAHRLGEVFRIVSPRVIVAHIGAAEGVVSPEELADSGDGFEPAPIATDDPCYVMFTSGTTGEPKGVVVPHRAVLRLVLDPDFMEIGPDRTWLHVSSTSFDASTLEIWAPLLNGGCCVAAADRLPSIERIASLLKETGVTDTWLTASLFNAVVDHAPSAFEGLGQVFTGGERLSPGHVRRFLDRWPGVRLVNGYGPTENTTFTCCHTITPEDTDNPGGLPIGRPIRGTEILVLDRENREVSDGEPGELVAGGLGVALGYLNDDELTRRRFVELPGRAGTWYRTGDLVRRRADGVVEYIGRRDRQVKVRGYRIELEEVERQIAMHPGVDRAFAMMIGDRADLNRLAAAFTRRAEGVSPGQLRGWLAERVPAHVVPDLLVPLDSTPVGPTGKSDGGSIRRAIEAAAAADRDGAGHDDPIWRSIAGVIRDLLPGSRPDPGAGFLEIGGHSIAALRLAARILEEHGARVSIGEILGTRTLGSLAGLVRSAWAGAAEETVEAEPPGGSPVYAGSMQEQFYFEHAVDPSGASYHEFAAFRADGSLDLGALESAWRGLVRRHEAMRTRLELLDDRLVQRIDPPGADASAEFTVHDPVAWEDGEPPAEVLASISRPFDLGRDLPARLGVFPVLGGGFAVVFVFHHAAVDEWTLSLLRAELGALYDGSAGPPEPVPFRRFAAHEAATRSASEIVLVARRLIELPHTDAPLGRVPGPAERLEVRFDGLTLDGLTRRSAGAGHTATAVLLGLYAHALCRVFDRSGVAILTPLSCRTSPLLQRVVGCCNVMHPVIVDGCGGDVRRCIDAAGDDLIAAYQRPLAPFTDVVRAVHAQTTGRGFAVEFGFALETQSRFAPDLAGVRTRPLRIRNGSARFPVGLLLDASGGVLTGTLSAPAGSPAADRLPGVLAEFERGLSSLRDKGGQADPGRSVSVAVRSVAPESPSPIETFNADDPIHSAAKRAWEDLLGVPARSPRDRFFDKGGHSLMLLRLAARIRDETGVEMPIAEFLDEPTFGRLLAVLGEEARNEANGPFQVEDLGDGPATIICLPGAFGRPVQFSTLAERLDERGAGVRLRCYNLYDAMTRRGVEEGLGAVLDRLARDMREPGVVGVLGFCAGGLFPLMLGSPPPVAPPRLWLVDVYPISRGERARHAVRSAGEVLARPARVPRVAVDSVMTAGRLVRHRFFPSPEDGGIDMPRLGQLLRLVAGRRLDEWTGPATVLIAGRKPIWRPYYHESRLNGLEGVLRGPTRGMVLSVFHHDLFSVGVSRIADEIIADLSGE